MIFDAADGECLHAILLGDTSKVRPKPLKLGCDQSVALLCSTHNGKANLYTYGPCSRAFQSSLRDSGSWQRNSKPAIITRPSGTNNPGGSVPRPTPLFPLNANMSHKSGCLAGVAGRCRSPGQLHHGADMNASASRNRGQSNRSGPQVHKPVHALRQHVPAHPP